MTLTFVSNYINHHQIPFSLQCYKELGEGYHFIQTEPMETERIAMGWDETAAKLPFVLCMYENEARCRELIQNSDVAVFGWTRDDETIEALVRERADAGKITLRVSERLYREGQWKAVSPRGLIQKYKTHTRYRKQNVCLLCSGAYVASDFHIIRAYPGKMLRFGYFPETVYYTEEELKNKKRQDGKVHIVWAGRFMPLKHPEFAVKIAKELSEAQLPFHMHMAGGGEMEEELRAQVQREGMSEAFTFYGFMKPEKVRKVMEECQIHLFTSNYLEGWGAVVNEAMNSGCAVVASVEAGAVPFLIRHGENGLVYQNGSYEDFAGQVKRLVQDKEMTERLGRAAYETITGDWNAEHAAKELLRFCRDMEKGKFIPAKKGPLSAAPVVPPRKMYQWVANKRM